MVNYNDLIQCIYAHKTVNMDSSNIKRLTLTDRDNTDSSDKDEFIYFT